VELSQNVYWSRPHYCMDPDVSWRNGRRCPLVVHYWAHLQSVHGFCCYDNIAPNAKCQRVLVLALCLVVYFCGSFSWYWFCFLSKRLAGRASPKWPILCRVECKTLTQSINVDFVAVYIVSLFTWLPYLLPFFFAYCSLLTYFLTYLFLWE